MFKINDLTVNMMVKNESSYILQSLNSIAPFVNRVICFDTGSTDDTFELVRKLQKIYPHIELYSKPVIGDSINWNGQHLNQELTNRRNEMLDLTTSKYILQLDGDECYSLRSIATLGMAVDTINNPQNAWVKGLMIKIKWCISDKEYVEPGPFPKTLRVFQNGGRWIGKFPDEFYYLDAHPIYMNDVRCQTIKSDFLHMSMALHPERRPPNGIIKDLTQDEQDLLSKQKVLDLINGATVNG